MLTVVILSVNMVSVEELWKAPFKQLGHPWGIRSTELAESLKHLIYRWIVRKLEESFGKMPILIYLCHFYVILCHFMSFYVILCHFMSFYVIFCHFMSFNLILCHFMALYGIIWHFMSFCVILCHFMSLYVILCHFMSFLVFLSHFKSFSSNTRFGIIESLPRRHTPNRTSL